MLHSYKRGAMYRGYGTLSRLCLFCCLTSAESNEEELWECCALCLFNCCVFCILFFFAMIYHLDISMEFFKVPMLANDYKKKRR